MSTNPDPIESTDWHGQMVPYSPPDASRDGYDWPGSDYRPPQARTPRRYPAHQVVAPKNPAVNAIVGLFFPGVGNMLGGRTGKGVALLLTTLLAYISIVVAIGLIWVPVMHFIVGPVTAYRDAQKWNADHGIVS